MGFPKVELPQWVCVCRFGQKAENWTRSNGFLISERTQRSSFGLRGSSFTMRNSAVAAGEEVRSDV